MTDSNRAIPADRFAARLAACREAVSEHGFGALLIGVGPDLRYLTGFVGEPMERLTLLVVPREGPVSFVVPRLEATKAGATPLSAAGAATIVAFEETDDAFDLVAGLLADAGTAAGSTAGPIGLSDRLWAMHVLGLQYAASESRFESAGPVGRC